MQCPRCQQDNPSHATFCLACGTSVAESPSQARRYADLTEEIEGLRRSLGEALEQRTATGAILHAISRSSRDLPAVLDAVVSNAARLSHSANVSLYQVEGDRMRKVAEHEDGPQLTTLRVGETRPITRTSVSGRAIIDRTMIHVRDHQSAEVAREFPDGARRDTGIYTTLGFPLLGDGRALGAFTVYRTEHRPFTQSEIALLQSFADQAVIAIENVRLFKELEARNKDLTEALDQQTATSEVLKVISRSTFDLQPVLETLIENATKLCDASAGTIWRFDGEVFRVGALYAASPELRDVWKRGELQLGRGSSVGRAGLERRAVQILDVLADPEYQHHLDLQRIAGVRTIVGIPMLREGALIGAFSLWRTEVRAFSDKQIELVKTFADQAVIAIENVRLFTELEARNCDLTEALEQQTATAEVLRAISSSTMDAQPIFQTIAESAVRLSGALFGSVYRFDGELMHMVAHHNYPTAALEFSRRFFPAPPSRQSFTGRAIVERAVVHVPDVSQDQERLLARDLAETVGFRSALSVPMLREGDPIGAITVWRADVGPFSDKHVALLQTFADQAVIAIQNERLFRELQDRTAELTRSVERLTALGEVGRAVSSTLDLETVLTTIVSRAVQLSSLDGGVVFEYDEGTEEFVQRAATDPGGALTEARRTTRIRKGEGVLGRTAITLEPIQVPDITVPAAYEGRLRETLVESGIRAILAVPMVREGQLIGCLGVTRNRPGAFLPETIELLRTFATQSALAIQNARLFEEIADKSRQLEAASRHKSEFLANMSHELRTPLNAVIGFSEVLLQRMFGELNAKQDEYLKDIYASGQHLLSLINDILDLSKIEAGRMELSPAPFHLPTTLENAVTLVKERASRHGIALELDLDPRLGEVVGDERKVKQVLLNLLSNAVKFTSEGGRISLKARLTDGMVEISVTDTGVGIAPEDQAAIFEEFRQVGSDERRKQEGTGLGLTLAKKFVELHGGRIWVESEPGRGSTFTFTSPVS